MFDKQKADIAFRQDRERFFEAADKFESVSYLAEKLTAAQKKELEKAKKEWRDMTEIENYPDIDFPLAIPDFIKVKIFSSHKKNTDEKIDPDFVEVK